MAAIPFIDNTKMTCSIPPHSNESIICVHLRDFMRLVHVPNILVTEPFICSENNEIRIAFYFIDDKLEIVIIKNGSGVLHLIEINIKGVLRMTKNMNITSAGIYHINNVLTADQIIRHSSLMFAFKLTMDETPDSPMPFHYNLFANKPDYASNFKIAIDDAQASAVFSFPHCPLLKFQVHYQKDDQVTFYLSIINNRALNRHIIIDFSLMNDDKQLNETRNILMDTVTSADVSKNVALCTLSLEAFQAYEKHLLCNLYICSYQ